MISDHTISKNGITLFTNKSGPLSDFLLSAYKNFEFNYPKFYKMDNLSKAGWLASELLLKDSLLPDEYLPFDVGVVLANASASLDTDIRYFKTTKDIASPALFVYTLPNIVIGEICIRHGFKGENAFFIQEKFDESFLEQYVSSLVNNNILQACVCGWIELLEEQYKIVLFLVEAWKKPGSILFTPHHLNKLYKLQHG